MRPDGTWLYSYFQEGDNPEGRDTAYTNRGLIACWRDQIPVGVMRQIRAKPNPLYHVLGLAIVAGWDGGYFFLEGFTVEGYSHDRGPGGEIEALTISREQDSNAAGVFDPESIVDGRERIVASIVRRRGQPEFRRRLLELYEGRCAISGCDVVER
jgi:putative restriction endonuclease